MTENKKQVNNAVFTALKEAFAQMNHRQVAEMFEAVGDEEKAEHINDGAIMCCGHQVEEGDRCPVCGDVNN